MIRVSKVLAVVSATLMMTFGAYSPSAQLAPISRVRFVETLSDHISHLLLLAFHINKKGLELRPDRVKSSAADSSKVAIDDGSEKASRLINTAASDLIEWVYLVGNCTDCVKLPDADCSRLVELKSGFAGRFDSVKSILSCQSTPADIPQAPFNQACATMDSVFTMLDTFCALECDR